MSQQPMVFEQTLSVIKKAYCYRVSPNIDLLNFKCEGWQQDDIIFTGDVRVFSLGDDCFISLIDSTTMEERTRFPIEFKGGIPVIQKAIDSSRYFVIIVRNPATGQTANVGLGFQDRESAFNFKFALTEHGKWLTRKDQPVNDQKMDFSLKQGEAIKLNLKVGGNTTRPKVPAAAFVSSFAPPPGF